MGLPDRRPRTTRAEAVATALLLGAILALVTPETALAKIVGCPPGRFEVTGG